MSEAVAGKIDGQTVDRSRSITGQCAIGVGLLLDVIATTRKAIRRAPFKFGLITKLHPGIHLLVARNIDPTESKYPSKYETTIHISE